MGSYARRQFLIRPGALGDALLTVPLLTRLALNNPGQEVQWYQSPWTCELPWARILPLECAQVQVRNFESPEIAALYSENLEKVERQLSGMEGGDVIDVSSQAHETIAKIVAHLSTFTFYHWILAPMVRMQQPPHAAERLCQVQFNPQAPVRRHDPPNRGELPVDLQREWLRNPVPVAARDEHCTLIHPGAGSRKKQLPIEHWIEMAKRQRATGRRVRYLLGPAELERGMRPMIEALDPGATIATPELKLLPDLVGAAGEFWGHDSGPSHLAGMMGLPTHVFFGPTNPEVWRPLGPRVTVYRF
ncbi:MAG: glycosyltransferase family 9 protein [Planctomycetota bacterium]